MNAGKLKRIIAKDRRAREDTDHKIEESLRARSWPGCDRVFDHGPEKR